ncbi:MAG: hypothetical protein COV45_08145 [Deltaproteobacteria bacterium CG11_big_fil_rev_8_21_14_0_20_47_16]|nr:MAG: hypothetical protein COV45_08145 [Deltaproteobacteria bacterium CG11_big_fil_rev_8_21_14_0_20_47_16]
MSTACHYKALFRLLALGVISLTPACGDQLSTSTNTVPAPAVSAFGTTDGTLIATTGTTDIPVAAAFSLYFSTAMNSATVNTTNVTLSCDATSQTVTIATVTNSNYTITPASSLAEGVSCVMTLSTSITSSTGTALASTVTFTFTTASTVPTVSSLVQGSTTIATSGTTGISRTAAYTLTFSQAMLASTVTTSSVTLTCSTSRTITVAQVTSGTTSTAYTVTPSATLPASTSCTLAVGTGATNSSGTAVTAKSYTFTTAAATAPTVSLTGTLLSSGSSTTINTSGTTDISGAIAAPLTATFSTAMDTDSFGSVTLECPASTSKSFTTGTGSNPTITFTPSAALPQMQTCVLTLPTSVTSSGGDPIAATTFTYTTGCGTSDDFSTATFSSSSTICWTPSNAANAGTFTSVSGDLVITPTTSGAAQNTEPTATKTFPSSTTAIVLTAKIGYSNITESGERCTLGIFSGFDNSASVGLVYAGEVQVNGFATNGGAGVDVSATAPASPVYVRITISGGATTTAYSSDGTSYTNLFTNGVWTDPAGDVSVYLSARSSGSVNPVCTFQEFTVSGATATGQYSN